MLTNMWCPACGSRITPPNWVISGLAYCLDCDRTPEMDECD